MVYIHSFTFFNFGPFLGAALLLIVQLEFQPDALLLCLQLTLQRADALAYGPFQVGRL